MIRLETVFQNFQGIFEMASVIVVKVKDSRLGVSSESDCHYREIIRNTDPEFPADLEENAPGCGQNDRIGVFQAFRKPAAEKSGDPGRILRLTFEVERNQMAAHPVHCKTRGKHLIPPGGDPERFELALRQGSYQRDPRPSQVGKMRHGLPDGFIFIADNAGDLRIAGKPSQHHRPFDQMAEGGCETLPVHIESGYDRIGMGRIELTCEFIQILSEQQIDFPAAFPELADAEFEIGAIPISACLHSEIPRVFILMGLSQKDQL